MRVVVQRVSRAGVEVEGKPVAGIERGILILAAFRDGDSPQELDWMARKCLELRIFEDEEGKMNRSLMDVGGEVLVVSQFTLYGDCRKGRRPSYSKRDPFVLLPQGQRRYIRGEDEGQLDKRRPGYTDNRQKR